MINKNVIPTMILGAVVIRVYIMRGIIHHLLVYCNYASVYAWGELARLRREYLWLT